MKEITKNLKVFKLFLSYATKQLLPQESHCSTKFIIFICTDGISSTKLNFRLPVILKDISKTISFRCLYWLIVLELMGFKYY